jgi:hypothetical protein
MLVLFKKKNQKTYNFKNELGKAQNVKKSWSSMQRVDVFAKLKMNTEKRDNLASLSTLRSMISTKLNYFLGFFSGMIKFVLLQITDSCNDLILVRFTRFSHQSWKENPCKLVLIF